MPLSFHPPDALSYTTGFPFARRAMERLTIRGKRMGDRCNPREWQTASQVEGTCRARLAVDGKLSHRTL